MRFWPYLIIALCLMSHAVLVFPSVTAGTLKELGRQNRDCRLSGIWVADSGDVRLSLSGASERSGGSFVWKKAHETVSGGYRMNGNSIHFQGTDNHGQNRDWTQHIVLDPPANPSAFRLDSQPFHKEREDETDTFCYDRR